VFLIICNFAGTATSRLTLRTSTVPAVPQCPGVQLRSPVPGGYKYEDLAVEVGGVSDETDVVTSSAGLGPECDSELYRPVLSPGRAPHNMKATNAR
jgi:hypothetical protein